MQRQFSTNDYETLEKKYSILQQENERLYEEIRKLNGKVRYWLLSAILAVTFGWMALFVCMSS